MKHLKVKVVLDSEHPSRALLTIVEQTHKDPDFSHKDHSNFNNGFIHKNVLLASSGAPRYDGSFLLRGTRYMSLFLLSDYSKAKDIVIPSAAWIDLKEAIQAYNEYFSARG